jgi:hypothetical protein
LDVTVPRNGRFRVDATDAQNWVTVFHGKVDVANGQSTTALESGKTLHVGGEESAVKVDAAAAADAFDKWVSQRDRAAENSQADAGDFVSQRNYAYNVGDLYTYGLWSNISGYGMAWQPYGLGLGWMPFGNGQWMMGDPSMGWMWMSFEPWGWLPYHYGGWVNIGGQGWFWIPQNLGAFQGATANFVNVGNAVGWTPAMATPTNPRKVKTGPTAPIQVVFAGNAANGVIAAGPRGQLNGQSTLRSISAPVAGFSQQSAPAVASLAAAGVSVTGRAAVRPVSTTYTPAGHGTAGTSTAVQAKLSGPNARPAAMAPHSAAVPVVRAPSTFASVNSGVRSAGVTPASSGGHAAPVASHAAAASAAGSDAHSAGAASGTTPIKH